LSLDRYWLPLSKKIPIVTFKKRNVQPGDASRYLFEARVGNCHFLKPACSVSALHVFLKDVSKQRLPEIELNELSAILGFLYKN
jgi:hypothetical protein